MKREFKSQIIKLLDAYRIMAIATNRADGWPQNTMVGYVNDGLIIYTFVARDSQKFLNISYDSRVSIAIANDVPQPLLIKGLSIAARVVVAEDKGEFDHAQALLVKRYPEYKIMPSPNQAAVALLRITPEIVSVLDYSKGFGHADLVRVTAADLEEFIESRRHHWASHPTH
jgi:general stress protein 26